MGIARRRIRRAAVIGQHRSHVRLAPRTPTADDQEGFTCRIAEVERFADELEDELQSDE